MGVKPPHAHTPRGRAPFTVAASDGEIGDAEETQAHDLAAWRGLMGFVSLRLKSPLCRNASQEQMTSLELN